MSVSDILAVLSQLLGPETQAMVRSSGFCQRRSKLSGAAFVQGLVFGWLHDPQARVCDLAHAMACAGSSISPQALQQRFNPRSAALLQSVLTRAVQLNLKGDAQPDRPCGSDRLGQPNPQEALLPGGFSRVWLQDSTVIALPAELAQHWPGGSGAAALKVQVRFDLQSGALAAPLLVPGRWHDLRAVRAAKDHPAPAPEELHIADLGYFDLQRLSQIAQNQAFFLSRLKVGTHLEVEGVPEQVEGVPEQVEGVPEQVEGVPEQQLSRRLDQVAPHVNQVEWQVKLGRCANLPCRLLAVRVPCAVAAQRRVALEREARRKGQSLSLERVALCGWTVLVTNAPKPRLNLAQALALYGARWQIERLFRLWKETLGVTQWRSGAPYRILCEVYAKLLVAWISQCLLQRSLRSQPQRSLHKAIRHIEAHAMLLLHALHQHEAIAPLLEKMLRAMPKTATTLKRLSHREKPKNQLLSRSYSTPPFA